jgi:hypothetical protein
MQSPSPSDGSGLLAWPLPEGVVPRSLQQAIYDLPLNELAEEWNILRTGKKIHQPKTWQLFSQDRTMSPDSCVLVLQIGRALT